MKLHTDSHLDHDLPARQLAHLLLRFADRTAFFCETISLPEDLGDLPCALVGPAAGTPAPDANVIVSHRRGDRAWNSRAVIVQALPRTRLLTVVAGPHAGEPCVLYTCYGGPAAPREPGDIRLELEELERARGALPDRSPENAEHTALYAQIEALRVKRAESDAFWAQHALAVVEPAVHG